MHSWHMLALLIWSDVSDFSEQRWNTDRATYCHIHACFRITVHNHIVINPQSKTYVQCWHLQTKNYVDDSSAVRLRKCNILLRILPHLEQKQRCCNRDFFCSGATATLNDCYIQYFNRNSWRSFLSMTFPLDLYCKFTKTKGNIKIFRSYVCMCFCYPGDSSDLLAVLVHHCRASSSRAVIYGCQGRHWWYCKHIPHVYCWIPSVTTFDHFYFPRPKWYWVIVLILHFFWVLLYCHFSSIQLFACNSTVSNTACDWRRVWKWLLKSSFISLNNCILDNQTLGWIIKQKSLEINLTKFIYSETSENIGKAILGPICHIFICQVWIACWYMDELLWSVICCINKALTKQTFPSMPGFQCWHSLHIVKKEKILFKLLYVLFHVPDHLLSRCGIKKPSFTDISTPVCKHSALVPISLLAHMSFNLFWSLKLRLSINLQVLKMCIG